MVVQKDNTL